MNVYAEIRYERASAGFVSGSYEVRHSLCPPLHSPEFMDDEVYRNYLHSRLDEWLEHSRGTGAFWIGSMAALCDTFSLIGPECPVHKAHAYQREAAVEATVASFHPKKKKRKKRKKDKGRKGYAVGHEDRKDRVKESR